MKNSLIQIYSFISLKIYILKLYSVKCFLNTVQINNKNIHLYQLYSPINQLIAELIILKLLLFRYKKV